MSGISTAFTVLFAESLFELRYRASERRVAADAVVVAIDVIEGHAACVFDRVGANRGNCFTLSDADVSG